MDDLVKRIAAAVLLLALVPLGWHLMGSPEQETARPEPEPSQADREQPTLKTTAGGERPESQRTPSSEPTAGDTPTRASGRQQYVIHVRGPDGVLTDAEVRVLRGDATEVLPRTDDAGKTTVTLASLRDAELAVCKHGYRVESHLLYQLDQWVAGGARHLVLKAERGVPIRGRVIDARTAAPIEGARGTVNDWGLNAVPIGPTDSEGWFTHPGVMDDNEARITVSAPGYATKEIHVFADSGRLRPEVPVLRLEAGGRLTGQVLSPDGDPAAGAAVRVVAIGPWSGPRETQPLSDENRADLITRYQYDDQVLRDSQSGITVQSLADGTFVADGLRFGASYKASASATGFAASDETPAIQADASDAAPRVTLRLLVASRIELRLVVSGSAPVEGYPRVRLFHRGVLIKPVRGASAGPYEFHDLAPGRYHVWAQVEGFLPALDQVVLAEGQTRAVDLAIDRGAEVEGVVVDEDGRPVAGIEVQVARATDNPSPTRTWLRQERKARTGAAGRFRVAGLSPTDSVLIANGYVEGRGWLATRQALRFSPPTRGVRVVVKPMGKVKMRLMKPDGAPFSGELWTMSYFGSGGGGGSYEVTDGYNEEGMLEEGEHHLILAPSGYAWFHRTVTIKDGNTMDWGEVTLGRGVTLTGRIVDKDGHPVKAASITCELWEQRATQTDADGRFALDRFPQERLDFRIEAEGFSETRRALEAGQPGLRIVLQRPATIEGTLASARGPAPRDTWIELRPVGTKLIKEELPGPDGTMEEWSHWEGAEQLGVDEQGRLSGEITPGAFDAFWYPEEGEAIPLGRFSLVEGENRGIRMVIPTK